ncbi:hypothetical protein RP20_CCG001098 [Aedes albopictus]|nr:hypothetical protein RP20_CCG001098 [Aedes albopictus]
MSKVAPHFKSSHARRVYANGTSSPNTFPVEALKDRVGVIGRSKENLQTSQRRLLKVTRDRFSLLNRLLQHEKTDLTTSESEETVPSDDSSKTEPTPTVGRKRKNDVPPIEKCLFDAQRSFDAGETRLKETSSPANEEVEQHLQLQSWAQAMLEVVPEGELPNEIQRILGSVVAAYSKS